MLKKYIYKYMLIVHRNITHKLYMVVNTMYGNQTTRYN